MAEILGLSVSQFPLLRMKPQDMANILKGLMRNGWKDFPDHRDPAKWPPEMRKDWDGDEGLATVSRAQEHQIGQFRKLHSALDEFQPDCVVMLYRDMGEPWGGGAGEPGSFRPKYWVHSQDAVTLRPYQPFAGGSNYWDEDPATEVGVRLHRDAADHLLGTLEKSGRKPTLCDAAGNKAKLGLGHNCVAGIIHLDWDRRTFDLPLVPIGIDPFGFNRARNVEGLSPWDRNAPPPLSPAEAFDLGRGIARTFSTSSWRVALVASGAWSSSQNTARSRGPLHPNHAADRARFEQWRSNGFHTWGADWTFEQMEENAQWEVLVAIVLAGAMTEIGAGVRRADLATNWILNANWVNTIFEPK
jgi:hypothetical protein